MPPKGTHFKMSDEARAKIGASLRGRKHSEETKKKISEGNRGLKRSAEAVENNRRAHIGLPGNRKGATHTEEAKQKLRDARSRQFHPKLALHGLNQEMVDAASIRGMRWCGGCKAFIFRRFFYGQATAGYCSDCADNANKRCVFGRTPDQRLEINRKLSAYRLENPEKTRKSWLRLKYGVTPEWYAEKLVEQDGHCALCPAIIDERKLPTWAIIKERQYLLVDHDHETGTARGLLCAKCNTALHRVEYVQDWAHRALAYLARYAVSDETNQKES